MKPYKAFLPYKTINKIRSILETLNIFTTEYHIGLDGFYRSCRVSISNKGLEKLDIGTNGKGLETDYALASAYGELMERIQNRMIFRDMFYATSQSLNKLKEEYPYFDQTIKKSNTVLEFRYYPDEIEYKLNTWKDLESHLKIYLPQVYNDTPKETLNSIKNTSLKYTLLQAPFYNVNKRSTENIPFQLIRLSSGSTGLCAGNTPEEAIIQGINEIFERYVLQQIYIRKVTPPTIPISHFPDNEVVQKLESLKRIQNITYEIKDCSLGENFPVIGLLLIDTKNNSYSFRLGADANPNIALQRCYTEAFQGVNNNNHSFNPIDFSGTKVDYKKEYNQNVINGSGRYPECIFLSNSTYPFKGLIRMNKETDKEELETIVCFIQKMDHTIYIRNNSFLHFPAYHIYIPGLSEVSPKLYSLSQIIDRLDDHDFTFGIPPEYHIKSLDLEGLKSLYSIISHRSESKIQLFPYYISPSNFINRNLLLALISFKLSELKNAFKHMSLYLKENEQKHIKVERYYYALRDFFYWKAKYKRSPIQLLNVMKRIYGENLANEILTDMSNKDTVFQYFQIPDCFNCEKCSCATKCTYHTLLRIDKRIQDAYKQNLPIQNEIDNIFHPELNKNKHNKIN